MGKPITLTSLRFYDSKGKFKVEDNSMYMFPDLDAAEIHIRDRHEHFEKLYKMELIISPDRNETLEEVDVKRVFDYTGEYFDISNILGKTRIPYVVEARRQAIIICIERGLRAQVVSRAIGFNHATISHHQKIFKNLSKTEKGYYDRFLDVQDYVLVKLNGRFKEDGSGEKLDKS